MAELESTSASNRRECDNNLRSIGDVDYGIGPETAPEADPPIEQAARYLDAVQFDRDFPGVKPLLADSEEASQLVALVVGDQTVGLLAYENDEQLGWHLTSTEECSPGRSGRG